MMLNPGYNLPVHSQQLTTLRIHINNSDISHIVVCRIRRVNDSSKQLEPMIGN